jgi:hypothetical protein
MEPTRYDRPSALPQPPTACEAYDAACRALNDARTARLKQIELRKEVERRIRRADEDWLLEAADAVAAGKEPPKDPRPALEKRRELLVQGEAVAKQVQVNAEAELDRVVEEHRATWLAAERERVLDDAQLASEQFEQFLQTLDGIRERQAVASWLDGGKLAARPLATKETVAIRKAIADVIDPPRTRYVTPANMAALQQGREAVTVDGEALPAGTSPASVTVSYTAKPRRGVLHDEIGEVW